MKQEKIGNFIKELRKSHHFTQAQFAEKYGVTYQAVSNWEHGKNLPDISLLKQMSKDFNISVDELLNGERKIKHLKKNVKYRTKILIAFLFFILIFIGVFFFGKRKDDNFEFKTISASCPNFNISGSISYNENKTAIYISDVNYCGKNDDTEYSNIECVLYETHNNTETKIQSCNYKSNQKVKLDEFLKSVEFTVNDYARSCKKYSNETLYLRINATEEDGKITTYKIPLSLNATCNS